MSYEIWKAISPHAHTYTVGVSANILYNLLRDVLVPSLTAGNVASERKVARVNRVLRMIMSYQPELLQWALGDKSDLLYWIARRTLEAFSSVPDDELDECDFYGVAQQAFVDYRKSEDKDDYYPDTPQS